MANNKNDSLPQILVVDDDEKNIHAMDAVLSDFPLDVRLVMSGEEALNIASSEPLALILLDVQMPTMDGFEVASLLSKNKLTKQIPVIFLTANNKEEDFILKGHELGAVDYLFKPIDPSIFKSKVMVFVDYYVQRRDMKVLLDELASTKRSLEESNAQLNRLARVDTVTELPNRLNFEELLAVTLEQSRRHERKFAVIYMDLDNFKYVNDTCGHDVGDMLLTEVGVRVKGCVRKSDAVQLGINEVMVARLGGDEFAVLLSDIFSPSNAGVVVEMILSAISKRFVLNDHKVSIGVSIGIACYPYAGNTEEELKKAADLAMYKAKENGKNTFYYYTNELNAEYHRYILLETNLKSTIAENGLSLVYQPVLSIESEKVLAIEVLCRWKHKELGSVCPDEFIKIAEETGAIHQLGLWVFNQTLLEVQSLAKDMDDDVLIHINLSVKQLELDLFIERAREVAKQKLIDPRRIVFELTETAFMEDRALIEEKVNSLYVLGYKFSVDDFGTGYSSLGRLKNLPISSIKVDKSFVDKINEDEDVSIILASMVTLANSLEVASIAEGVETKEQLSFLRKLGCQQVQGFYFAKPMLLPNALDYISKQNAK